MRGWSSIAAVALALAIRLGSPGPATPSSEKPAGTPGTTSTRAPAPVPSPVAAPAFLDTTAPMLRVTEASHTEPIDVLVNNMGKADFDGHIKAMLRTARGREIPPTLVPCQIKSGELAQKVEVVANLVPLQRDDYPLSGWLVLSSGASDGPVVKLEIKAEHGPVGDDDWELIACSSTTALASMVIAAIAAVVWGKNKKTWRQRAQTLLARMGSPTWDFTKSWSSTLTLAGAGLATLFALTSLPEHGHHFGKVTYALLSTLFAALIGLAPAVYNLFRDPVQSKADDGTVDIQYQGFVLLFLAAGVLTMTGVFAQLRLLRDLVDDLAKAALLSSPASDAFWSLFLFLQVALFMYAVVSACQAILKQGTPKAEAVGEQPAKFRRTGALADANDRSKRALPDWPLL